VNFSSKKQLLCAASMTAVATGALMLAGVDAHADAQTSAQTPSAEAPDQAASGLAEIVVTARRRAENQQTVPVAVTVLSGAALGQQAVVRLENLPNAVPGVTVQPGTVHGSEEMVVTIRGQRNFDPTIGSDPAVGIYFDEVAQSKPFGSNAAFFDIQSVQVLKGPQGTLFGRNTTGGAILITPNPPVDRFEGYVQATGGSYGLKGSEAMINVPLNDQWALRVAESTTNRDGYVHNVSNGQWLDNVDNQSVRASLGFNNGNGIKSVTTASFFHSSTNGDAYKLDTISPNSFVNPLTGGALYNFVLVPTLAATAVLGRYELANSIHAGEPYTQDASQAQAAGIDNITSIKLSDNLTLKNIIGYRTVQGNNIDDLDGTAVDLYLLKASDNDRTVSEEAQLLGNSGKLDYVAGLYYFRESGNSSNYAYSSAAFPFAVSSNAGDGINTSYSAYGHVNYKLDELIHGLSLSGGFRFTRDEREMTIYSYNDSALTGNATASGVSATCVLTGLVTAFDSVKSACANQDKVYYSSPTWDVSINEQITPETLIYLASRRGYRSGGFAYSNQTLADAATPFKPETINDVELGLKADWHAGGIPIRTNIDGYYSQSSNIQRQFLVFSQNLAAVTVNAKKAHTIGLEAEIDAKPVRSVEVSMKYAYTNPKYTNYVDNVTFGPAYPIDIADSPYAYVPKNQASAVVSWTLPVPNNVGIFTLNADYSYQSSFVQTEITTSNCHPALPAPYTSYPNCEDPRATLPSYSLLNTRLNINHPFGARVNLAVFVTNVTDKFYRPSGQDALGIYGTRVSAIGPPRMFGVEVRVPFGAFND
jgi:iron complex outermembrane receptor protein